MPDPYAELGIDRGASSADVRSAYRRLALRLHPDKAPPGDDGEAFKRATGAYELLSDAGRRERFDRFGETLQDAAPESAFPMPDIHDILSGLFDGRTGRTGGTGRTGRTGWTGGAGGAGWTEWTGGTGGTGGFTFFDISSRADVADAVDAVDSVDVHLTLPELYTGAPYKRRVDLRIEDCCPACKGSGATSPGDCVECLGCRGTGHSGFRCMLNGTELRGPPCGSCNGRGRGFESQRRCVGCGGSGHVPCDRSFEVRVKPGIPDGHRQLVLDRGGYDVRSGAHRSVLLRFRWPPFPPGYVVDGVTGDVEVTERLELADVLCGFSRRVELFGGADAVDLTTPAYAPPDRTISLPGRGLVAQGGGCRGRLTVRFEVTWPREPSTLCRYRDVLCRLFARPQKQKQKQKEKRKQKEEEASQKNIL